MRLRVRNTSKSAFAAILAVFTAIAMTSGLGVSGASAQQRIPAPVGYVNDFANVISPEREASISRIIDEVRTKSGGEIVVVTLASLEGEASSALAMRIGREWKIGKAGKPGDVAKETGIVFLVSPGDRKVEIATGYGTNAFISATEAGRIQDQYVLPSFRAGDYGAGIEAGVAAIALQYAERFGFEMTGVTAADTATRPVTQRRRGFNPIFIFIIIAVLVAMSRGRGGRGGRGGGGGGSNVLLGMILGQMMSGGGRGGFGGGGFGGGGFGGGGGGFGGFGGSGGFGGGGAGRSW